MISNPNDKPWMIDADDLLKQWNVDKTQGLAEAQIAEQRSIYGPNRLQESRPESIWIILWNQLKGLIVFLLLGAAAAAFIFHEAMEGIAILAVIVINTLIGFITEIRAVRSMEALKRLGGVSVRVRREGHVRELPVEELVPGDIVILEGGDLVGADMRLVTCSKLQADESALTGESAPVSKSPDILNAAVPLAERRNMIYKGTALTRGSGEAIVVATGMNTELGKIASMIQRAEKESTPLERRLNKMGQSLVWITLMIAFVVAISGMTAGKHPFLMIETAIALAVAAIPEGLPVVATIALARGMFRMARQNALIRKLSAVETLGATTVIFTDKTGTLTENRMTVSQWILPSGNIEIQRDVFYKNGQPIKTLEPNLKTALEISILCNNASLPANPADRESGAVGDPLEIAMLQTARTAGMDIEAFRLNHSEEREDAFDSESKRMATFNRFDHGYRVSIKGAIEAVLNDCTRIWSDRGPVPFHQKEKQQWLKTNTSLGERGLRVLALAMKKTRSTEDDPYQDAVFIGLLGLLDPPREDVKDAVAACHQAGIQVIMVTGDQPVTAKNIGNAVGLTRGTSGKVLHSTNMKPVESMSEQEKSELLDVPIFARVTPKQKLDLIALRQQKGDIVAMTGDGVNDAPALKKADIGVAMGLRGTQVAQEAADMVLKDDAFATIIKAIREGRIIFGNIRKAVQFLLSCNVSEVLAVGIASIANAPLPILPLQILYLNLVTDVFPALALSVGEGDPTIMKHPPRPPAEAILGRRQWMDIFGFGLLMTISVLGALAVSLMIFRMDHGRAVSVSFLTLGFNQLWHVFNMRDRGSKFLKNEISGNPMVWGAIVICMVLLLGAVFVPGLSSVLKVSNPGFRGWLLILAASLFPWCAGQMVRSVPRKSTATARDSALS
ncbi:cation-transporting P-type ATPase [bacterium]|nr:cation-transporting P-type ATPase [bacterium]